ncbi:MAG: hypothetical protein JSS86_14575 [Cyanobacteria bacterium SZAS LIN-2]|nr:hypothetical protein [Cyanobacteria bacterium SZAS LIN-2]
MSAMIQTITRYSNGFVVYGNDSCVRTKPRPEKLRLVWDAARSSAPVRKSADAPRPVAHSISVDPLIDTAARNLAFWLEEQYMENRATDFSGRPAAITIPDLPPPEVLEQAYRILRQRGWLLDAQSRLDVTLSGNRSAVVGMRLADF